LAEEVKDEVSHLPNIMPQSAAQQDEGTIRVSLLAKKRPPPMNIGFNEFGADEKRHVLYRNLHEISGIVYLVEVSRCKTKVFVLLFENYECPQVYLSAVMKEKIAIKLMQDSNNSFE
jgi:hypothetical protein